MYTLGFQIQSNMDNICEGSRNVEKHEIENLRKTLHSVKYFQTKFEHCENEKSQLIEDFKESESMSMKQKEKLHNLEIKQEMLEVDNLRIKECLKESSASNSELVRNLQYALLEQSNAIKDLEKYKQISSEEIDYLHNTLLIVNGYITCQQKILNNKITKLEGILGIEVASIFVGCKEIKGDSKDKYNNEEREQTKNKHMEKRIQIYSKEEIQIKLANRRMKYLTSTLPCEEDSGRSSAHASEDLDILVKNHRKRMEEQKEEDNKIRGII